MTGLAAAVIALLQPVERRVRFRESGVGSGHQHEDDLHACGIGRPDRVCLVGHEVAELGAPEMALAFELST